MKHYLIVASLCACLLASPGSSASAFDTVLTALTAVENAPSVRAVLKLEKDGVTRAHVMERVKPDRVRIVLDADRSSGREIVLIGATTYSRGPDGWTSIPSAPFPLTMLSATGLFRNGLTQVSELGASAARRTFTGRMEWSNGGEHSQGRLTIAISVASGRVEKLMFEGECGAMPCRFTESLSYDPALVIKPPL